VTTVLDRWGNSLGLRLPKDVAEAAGLREGDRVRVEIENGAVTIRHTRPTYTLQELLVGMTPQSVHAEFEFGAAVGAERFWEPE
jgi:antitoxin MazE